MSISLTSFYDTAILDVGNPFHSTNILDMSSLTYPLTVLGAVKCVIEVRGAMGPLDSAEVLVIVVCP